MEVLMIQDHTMNKLIDLIRSEIKDSDYPDIQIFIKEEVYVWKGNGSVNKVLLSKDKTLDEALSKAYENIK